MEKLTSMPPKDGRVGGLPLAARKIFSVVTSPVTAEKRAGSLLSFGEMLPFLCMRRHFSCLGLLGVSAFFIFIFLFYSNFLFLSTTCAWLGERLNTLRKLLHVCALFGKRLNIIRKQHHVFMFKSL